MPLTFVDQINDASHDVQWHTVGSHTPLREVYATSTSDYSRRRIMHMWTNATQGQSMCFRRRHQPIHLRNCREHQAQARARMRSNRKPSMRGRLDTHRRIVAGVRIWR